MRYSLPALVLALVGALMLFPATASAEPVIDSSTIENGYPRNLTFKITARGDSPVNDVTLRYSIKGRGTSALAKPANPIVPAAVVSAEIELDVNSSSAYIPVGSLFTYYWEVQSADGSVHVSPEQTFLFLPPDREWREVSNDFMTVHFYGDRESLARSYLDAGADTYQRIGRDLYGIELTNLPVRVILFANQQESELARPGSRGRFDAAVTVCGTKVTNDILLMIPESCGSPDITDVMRHELGHILNEIAGEGALAKLPSWLDEGAAVYAQTSPGGYEAAFNQAVAGNRLIPFNQMGVPTTDANRVGVFYGQAYFMVRYLIDREGEATFAEFMATIKRGTRFDQALQAIYGFDLVG
ncbi:MAG TPA: peptidase MA family metallohydrolase, partial [Tepidiformaceae bacterium]|nr:peptidase MA family metallohydrolase [Tepidiformaceae bacterium]